MKNRLLSYVALAVACLMLGSALTAGFATQAAADQTVTTVVTSPFTAAIALVRNSVVGVNNYQTRRTSPYGNDPFGFGYGFGYGYGYGWGNGQETEPVETLYATGSGVVVADKYVLTNYHVVENATSLKISISREDGGDPDTLPASLAGYDANLDIAVLYCETLNLAPVMLGDSDTLVVGDWAICIGNPLSQTFSGTVTAGIVSGLNRAISSGSSTTDRYGRRVTNTNTMIQIDAAINSGNSGGGMFSVTGELMGVPTLKYSGSTSSGGASIDGIGMCIPINSCKALIESVVNGKVTATDGATEDQSTASNSTGIDMTGRPRMGLTMTPLDSRNSSLSYGVRYAYYYGKLPSGVYVTEVEENGPAAQAGILPGDIIVDVNGTVITSSTQIQQIVSAHQSGETLQVKVYRVPGITELGDTTTIPDGEYVDLSVTLAVIDPVT